MAINGLQLPVHASGHDVQQSCCSLCVSTADVAHIPSVTFSGSSSCLLPPWISRASPLEYPLVASRQRDQQGVAFNVTANGSRSAAPPMGTDIRAVPMALVLLLVHIVTCRSLKSDQGVWWLFDSNDQERVPKHQTWRIPMPWGYLTVSLCRCCGCRDGFFPHIISSA
ncbi:uncharacterized protein B0I36DRAFT_13471 [Microdochium trichocladiopsis]|uniref:Uncharacterized protein n=1 Tax=Microdochium trichocladiopsis TaxID=1682393 RepID=A0A9P8YJN7_9PEZI|nr:uncharacterized protein B0I36DRAFT_13471 [Microdochium trichocladiopsis]KAH7040651.1 hypothetical protein B0I36DRAFT_13471 [Microdochium trichocladiopsis]